MPVVEDECVFRMKDDIWEGKYERDDGVGWFVGCS
jgi:hypothetical protein